MFSRLNKELNDFLINYAICAESNIFTDILIQFAGLDFTENQKQHFYFEKYSEEDHQLRLSIPCINLESLNKLLDFFDIHPSEYKTNQSLIISEKQIFQHKLPEFKKYIDKLALESPLDLKPYQLASKSKLEKSSLTKIVRFANQLITQLNIRDDLQALSNTYKKFTAILFQIIGAADKLNGNNKYYIYIVDARCQLSEFIKENDEFKNNPDYQSLITDLIQEFDTYITYNRAESALSIKKVFKELKEFLNNRQIEMGNSDILEHVLLDMAGINEKPSKAKFGKDGRDETRMVFRLKGISENQAKQFADYLRDHFDEGVIFDTSHNRIIPLDEEANREKPQRAVYKRRENAMRIPSYNFSVDGDILHKKIMPLFYEKISSATSEFLEFYQERLQVKNSDLSTEGLTNDNVLAALSVFKKDNFQKPNDNLIPVAKFLS